MSSRSMLPTPPVPTSRKFGETWGTPLFSPVIPTGAGWFAEGEAFCGVEGPCVSSISGTIQMCGVLVLASRSTSTTLKITHLPSGETSGSPTRFSFIMSSNVKGCLAWATAGNVRVKRRKKAREKRRIGALLGNQSVDVARYVSCQQQRHSEQDVASNVSTANQKV